MRWYSVVTTRRQLRAATWRLAGLVVPAPSGTRLQRGPYGKPQLPGSDLHFSISHHAAAQAERGIGVVAVSTEPIGVDVLGGARFSPSLRRELGRLAGIPEEVVSMAPAGECASWWCLVEATVKHAGGSMLAEFGHTRREAVLAPVRRGELDCVVTTVDIADLRATVAAVGTLVPQAAPLSVDLSELPGDLPSWYAPAA